MKKTITSLLILCSLILAFGLRPVDVGRSFEITPPSHFESESPDSNLLETGLPRNIITFNFPDGYFGEDNLIMEAVLKIEVEPMPIATIDEEEVLPIEALCLPLTRAPGAVPAWSTLESAYDTRYAEIGSYDEETGIITFEISRMLYDANEGDLDFHGVVIVPAAGSREFRLRSREGAIDFRTANYIGARATED